MSNQDPSTNQDNRLPALAVGGWFGDFRRNHQIGRHLLRFADSREDWCVRCGDFRHNLRFHDGTPTTCYPVKRKHRWWHPSPNG